MHRVQYKVYITEDTFSRTKCSLASHIGCYNTEWFYVALNVTVELSPIFACIFSLLLFITIASHRGLICRLKQDISAKHSNFKFPAVLAILSPKSINLI